MPSAVDGPSIGSLEDFAGIVASYLTRGLGGEIQITSAQVCDFLEATFQGSQAIGGTGAQGSAALGAVGMPVVTHLTDDSQEVAACSATPGVCRLPGETGSRL